MLGKGSCALCTAYKTRFMKRKESAALDFIRNENDLSEGDSSGEHFTSEHHQQVAQIMTRIKRQRSN